MRGKSLLLLIGLTLLSNATELKRDGWNLISACQDINSTDINMSGIQEIQAQNGDSIYTGDNAEYSNLDMLNAGYGYWVKGTKGINFDSKESPSELIRPLSRNGWNLMASCADTPRVDINMSAFSEIQSQDGQTIYSGDLAQYSNLDALINGYGYWVKGSNGANFISKGVLSIPFKFEHQVINNQGESVETTYEGYEIKLFADYNETANAQANHTGIVIHIDDNITVPTLNIQESYIGHNIVVGIYRNGELVGVSTLTEVDPDSPITSIDIRTDGSKSNDDPDTPTEKDRDATFQGLKVFATPLTFEDYRLSAITDADFNALSLENKRIVANKLLSLLFYGIPKMELDSMINSGKFISDLQTKIATPNSDIVAVEKEIKNKDYDWRNREGGKIMARLFNLDLGKEYINRWVAYQLTQTIMFSPAFELDTVSRSEVSNVYNNLAFYMDDEYSMGMITYLHMTSNDNWKRFRSPEDNGREMLEIFLFDFNDSDVPKAAIALKNWKLDKDDRELVIGLDQNDVPQNLFGTTVTTGFDFYRELVKSDAFFNGVIKRLVDFYFSNYTENKKNEIIDLIKASKPEQFQDILLQIVFSKEFLYNSNRVKSFEETAFGMGKKISFYDDKDLFVQMTRSLDGMHQGAMRYKLGRETTIPTDTLSFAYYYDFLRDDIMVNYKGDDLNEYDSGWQLPFVDKANPNTDTIEGFIDYLFLATVSRLPSSQERSTIVDYCNSKGYDDMDYYNDRKDAAIVTMEYISRLTEVYTFKSIEE